LIPAIVRPRSLALRIAIAVAAVVAVAAARAQSAAPVVPGVPLADEEVLEVRATFAHQPASEALSLIRPMLSPRGSVELHAETNTLVVHDTHSSLAVIEPVLRGFDHPRLTLRIEIQIVQASSGAAAAGASGPALPVELRERLRGLLRYESYQLLGRTLFTAREGEQVAYQIGDFGVSFRLGTLVEAKRIKFDGLRVVRDPGRPQEKLLLHSNLNPWLDKTTVLGLANDENSGRALMIVVACGRER
jgi:hypothetical protein